MHVREVAVNVPVAGAVNCAHVSASGEWKDHGGVGSRGGGGDVSHAYGSQRELCSLGM